jgi:hypothetical protein
MKLTDVINAWDVLEKVGKPELTFSLHKGNESKIDIITGLIEAMPSFNDKDNQVVSREIKKLINLLPKTYYNENNPNNGDFSFNTVTLKGDDTITLRSAEIVKGDNREHVQNIKSLVNTIGRNMKADEYTVKVEYYGYNMQEIIIRFWWD